MPEEARNSFLHVLAGGNLVCENQFSFSYRPIGCHMLLYTLAGSGRLGFAETYTALEKQCLLLFDCSQRFSIQSTDLPWAFLIFFVTGNHLGLFGGQLGAKKAPQFFLPDYSPLHKSLRQLLGISTDVRMSQFLQMQQLLNDIFTSLYLSECQKESENMAGLPSYLIELKDYFDHHYKEEFSLEECQEHFQINKYRICREFAKHFGEPPLRYRNLRRLEAAKEMLLATELNIHEISSSIGFENVNHFINLEFPTLFGNYI